MRAASENDAGGEPRLGARDRSGAADPALKDVDPQAAASFMLCDGGTATQEAQAVFART